MSFKKKIEEWFEKAGFTKESIKEIVKVITSDKENISLIQSILSDKKTRTKTQRALRALNTLLGDKITELVMDKSFLAENILIPLSRALTIDEEKTKKIVKELTEAITQQILLQNPNIDKELLGKDVHRKVKILIDMILNFGIPVLDIPPFRKIVEYSIMVAHSDLMNIDEKTILMRLKKILQIELEELGNKIALYGGDVDMVSQINSEISNILFLLDDIEVKLSRQEAGERGEKTQDLSKYLLEVSKNLTPAEQSQFFELLKKAVQLEELKTIH